MSSLNISFFHFKRKIMSLPTYISKQNVKIWMLVKNWYENQYFWKLKFKNISLFSDCSRTTDISYLVFKNSLMLRLMLVTSPSNWTPRRFPVLPSLDPYISFSCFTFPGAPYRIFLLFHPWLPCHFYLVIEQQHWAKAIAWFHLLLLNNVL